MTEIAIHPKRVVHGPRMKALGKSGRELYHKQRPRRAARRARYRQWQIHVLATWFDQFGRSGRVGCGGCIS